MREIFKNPKNLRKELLINICCYEKIKKETLEKKISFKDLNESKIKTYLETVRNFDTNKINGTEKLSQQESCYFIENNQMTF